MASQDWTILTQDSLASQQLGLANETLTQMQGELSDIKLKVDAISAAVAPVEGVPGPEPLTVGAGSVIATAGTPLQLFYTGDMIAAAGLLQLNDGIPDITQPHLQTLNYTLGQVVSQLQTLNSKFDVTLSSAVETIISGIIGGVTAQLSTSLPIETRYYASGAQETVVTPPLNIAQLVARALFSPQVQYFTDIEEPAGNKVGYINIPYLSSLNPVPDELQSFGNGKAPALPAQTMYDANLSITDVALAPASAYDPWKTMIDGTPSQYGPPLRSWWYRRNPAG